MNSPLVSVIIPSFNRLNYLLRSIESVFNQTYTKTEVIVINDGSTEEGYLEHKYIKDIKQINLEQNQKIINGFGPGNIRNFGINIASGDWIAFLDDDDLWLKEKLEIQLQKGGLFIAVGALHLPGEKGLIQLLEARGYTLKPIK